MPRPRNQTARRAQLVEAAAQTVLERGATNARLRDIAEQAGLTPASVSYYYPDLTELLALVFERGAETYIRHRRQALESCDSAWAKLAACIRSGVPFPGEAETTSRLLYELLPVAFRNAPAAEQQAHFVADQTDLYRQVLDEGDRLGEFRLVAPADFLARSFVALEDGYGMDVLAGSATAEDVENRLLLHAQLATQVTATKQGVRLPLPG
ncbi:TetR/AcrR family transcriptional regulator [Rhodococcus sp. WS4]|nr:TetR/AcrR family transcriptional regulator [Rhodococcus sp. WS4]